METRYAVIWVPTEAAEAVARKAGMRDGDGTSLWDWQEPEDEMVTAHLATFGAALVKARDVLPADVCGEVRIERELWVKDIDDRERWMGEAVWHLHDSADALDENEPDFFADAA